MLHSGWIKTVYDDFPVLDLLIKQFNRMIILHIQTECNKLLFFPETSRSNYTKNNVRNWCWFLPSSDSLWGLGQVQGRILRDLDGSLHGGQQTLTSLSPQGGAETLRTSDQKLHHNVGVFLHTLTLDTNTSGQWTGDDLKSCLVPS